MYCRKKINKKKFITEYHCNKQTNQNKTNQTKPKQIKSKENKQQMKQRRMNFRVNE
jgi:hypothetical protein